MANRYGEAALMAARPGVIAPNATRTSASAIEAYLQSLTL